MSVSVVVSRRVWEASRHNGATFTVLLALADYADDDGVAYPSVTALAKKARLSERMTQYAIGQLKASGEVAVEAGGGRHRTHRYIVTVPERVQSTVETVQALHPLTDPERVQSTTETVQSDAERVQSTASNGATVAPEPSASNHQEPSTGNHQVHGADSRIDEVYAYYRERINDASRTCPTDKIRARLRRFTSDELKRGIDNFAADVWSMKNNRRRPAAWFFHSDDRSENYLNMTPRTERAAPPRANDQLPSTAHRVQTQRV